MKETCQESSEIFQVVIKTTMLDNVHAFKFDFLNIISSFFFYFVCSFSKCQEPFDFLYFRALNVLEIDNIPTFDSQFSVETHERILKDK